MIRVGDTVQAVPPDLMVRAGRSAADGPRGFDEAMISIVKALSKDAKPDQIVAISFRLQALAQMVSGADISGYTMNLHGREYKLINEAALHAAATCSLTLTDEMSDLAFNRDEFLALALAASEAEGRG